MFAVMLLMVIYIGGSWWSVAIQDTARDVYSAYSIRHGEWFPTEGPILGGAVHLSPLWFYILALPLWVHDSWLSIAVFAAILGSFKFPLAVLVGSRLVDVKFGLLWACCLALPGWNTFEQLFFFNPNPAAAIVILAGWVWLRARRTKNGLDMFALGFVFSLALHIHPTAAPVMLLGLEAVRSSPMKSRFRCCACLAAGFLLPFIPYFIYQVHSGMPDAISAVQYLDSQVGASNLLNTPRVLAAYLVAGPQAIVSYLWDVPTPLSVSVALTICLPLAVLVGRAFKPETPPQARRVMAGLFGAFVLFGSWIALLRPTTPMYFTYVLSPFASGLLALGLWLLPQARSRWVVFGTATLSLVLSTVVAVQLALIVRSGEGLLSSRILDVKQWQAKNVFADTWFPASGRDSLGKFLCSHGNSSLHGHLAYIEDRSVGLDMLFVCGDASRVKLMGRDDTSHHWVGMSRAFWRSLGATPGCWSGSLGVAPVSAVRWPRSGIPIASGRTYFPRNRARAEIRTAELTFDTAPNTAVLISNPLLGYEALDNVAVSANGRTLSPIVRNDLSALFVTPPDRGPVKLSVSFSATSSELVDIVAFERNSDPGHAPDCGEMH
jgi:hypothetical protein